MVEGKEVKYKKGFNPASYKKIDIAKIIENLSDFQSWNIENLPSAEDHLLAGVRKHVEAGTVKEFEIQELAAIDSLAKEFKEAMVRRIGQGV